MKWLVILLTLLVAGRAVAQDTPADMDNPKREPELILVQSIPPGDDVIQVVRKGEPAPYTGHLYDQNTAIRWANWLQQYQELMMVYDWKYKKECKIQTDYLNSLLDIEKNHSLALERDAQARLLSSDKKNSQLQDKLDNPPWFKSGTFMFTVGAVSASALIFGVMMAGN